MILRKLSKFPITEKLNANMFYRTKIYNTGGCFKLTKYISIFDMKNPCCKQGQLLKIKKKTMQTNFIEVKDDQMRQMFLNLNQVISFKQAMGNDAWTDIKLANGETVIIKVLYHEFRKSLGLDKQ